VAQFHSHIPAKPTKLHKSKQAPTVLETGYKAQRKPTFLKNCHRLS